jgi:hypothetical protein
MQKIISLFQRNYDGDRLVRNEVVPGAEWVIAGEGIATRKFDGTCCMVRGGELFKRYDAKKGKTPPEGFEPTQEAPDPNTGHWPGWLKVSDSPEDRWLREALENTFTRDSNGNVIAVPGEGTYEAIGPKIGSRPPNPEKLDKHILIYHGVEKLPDAPREYEAIKEYLRERDIEGIVWHHPDGRMVKIKKKDFGFKRL